MIVILMPLAGWIKLVSIALIAMAASYHIALHALLFLPGSVVALAVDNQGGLTLIQKDHTELQALIMPSSFVTGYLTVLNLGIKESRWRRKIVLVVPDNADASPHRQLRVWLRWGSHQASQAADG